MKNKLSFSKKDKKWIVISLALILFCIFMMLKIFFGLFDFTSNYGIEKILTTKEPFDAALLIDEDYMTNWGILLDDHSQGDLVDIYFTDPKTVSEITIYNNTDYPFVPINISYTTDYTNYTAISYTTTVENDHITYAFIPAEDVKVIRIENNSVAPGKWPITEIVIR